MEAGPEDRFGEADWDAWGFHQDGHAGDGFTHITHSRVNALKCI